MSTSTASPPPTPSPAPPADDQRTRIVAAAVAVGAAALFLLAAIAVTRGGDDSTSTGDGNGSGSELAGAQVSPAYDRPQFTLTDTAGQPYDFGAATQGRLTLLFFGYTNCPDICPVQMATLTAALQSPGMPDPTVVFVTTDPARDTPERLRSWLDGFDESYVGLLGTTDQIAAAELAAKVPPSLITDEATGDYEVGHAAQVIAYTPDDKAHVVYPSGVRQQDWMADLPRLMERWG